MAELDNPYAPPGDDDEPPSTSSERPVHVPSGGLAVALRVLLGIDAVILLVECWTLVDQLGLLERMAAGEMVTMAEATANDELVNLVSLLWLLALIPSVILWCMWQQRTSTNLRACGATNMRFGPKAWGWFFCPFINLWRPVAVISELWRVAPRSDHQDPPAALLMAWWIPWLLGNMLSRISNSKMKEADESIALMIGSTEFAIASATAMAVAALAALMLVTRLQARARAAELNLVPAAPA